MLEVTGPDPASRRAKGKDDALDAIAAAEAARTRRRVQVAKDRSGSVEALRVLRTNAKDGNQVPPRGPAATPQHHRCRTGGKCA